MVPNGRANQKVNYFFILGKKLKGSTLLPFGLYGAGKEAHLHSNNTDNLIQGVHLTYPSSLLSIGPRETLETLRSLDVKKSAIRHLRVHTFNPKKNSQDHHG